MRNMAGLLMLLLSAAAVFPLQAAEFRTFVGVDVLDLETELDYSNGTETYEYKAFRLRYGLESEEGGSAGLELIAPGDDDTVDPFGTEFNLETGPAIGAYFTLGKPVYFRLGISLTQTEYTHVASGESDEDTIAALDFGLGFNLSLGPSLTLYGEASRRDSGEVDFGTFFTGDVDHQTDMLSLGLNYLF